MAKLQMDIEQGEFVPDPRQFSHWSPIAFRFLTCRSERKMNRKKWNAVHLKNCRHWTIFMKPLSARYGMVYEHPTSASKNKIPGTKPAEEKDKKK